MLLYIGSIYSFHLNLWSLQLTLNWFTMGNLSMEVCRFLFPNRLPKSKCPLQSLGIVHIITSDHPFRKQPWLTSKSKPLLRTSGDFGNSAHVLLVFANWPISDFKYQFKSFHVELSLLLTTFVRIQRRCMSSDTYISLNAVICDLLNSAFKKIKDWTDHSRNYVHAENGTTESVLLESMFESGI